MKTPETILEIARSLRKNMTPAEKKLWRYIRRDMSGYRFLRQKPIYVYTEDTGYDRFIIPDFYCHEKKLILEIDGDIHDVPEIFELDRVKEELLKQQDIRVWRIKNQDIIYNVQKVIIELKEKLSNK